MTKLKQFPPKDIVQNTKLYDEYVNVLHMQNGWDDWSQLENFNAMRKIVNFTGIPLTNTSCLDVGCGTGDLSKFLRTWNIKGYTGIDIYKPFLEQAKKTYPDELFIEGDLLQRRFKKKFDYVFCSGALTVKLSVDNYDFLESMVTKMWALSSIGIVFNVLTDEDPHPHPDLFFYNINHVMDICYNIAPDANLFVARTNRFAQAHFYMWKNK